MHIFPLTTPFIEQNAKSALENVNQSRANKVLVHYLRLLCITWVDKLLLHTRDLHLKFGGVQP